MTTTTKARVRMAVDNTSDPIAKLRAELAAARAAKRSELGSKSQELGHTYGHNVREFALDNSATVSHGAKTAAVCTSGFATGFWNGVLGR